MASKQQLSGRRQGWFTFVRKHDGYEEYDDSRQAKNICRTNKRLNVWDGSNATVAVIMHEAYVMHAESSVRDGSV